MDFDAFVAPTMEDGIAVHHHLAFPGTLSLSVSPSPGWSVTSSGRWPTEELLLLVLVRSHSRTYGPVAAAMKKIGPSVDGLQITALADQARADQRREGRCPVTQRVPLGEGGMSSGEWETSMLMAIHPKVVHLGARTQAGYVGHADEALPARSSCPARAGCGSSAWSAIQGAPAPNTASGTGKR